MNGFQTALTLVPRAVVRGIQNWFESRDCEQADGVALKGRHIGCELTDTTVIRLTPSSIRIHGLSVNYGHHGGIGQKLRPGGVGGIGPSTM